MGQLGCRNYGIIEIGDQHCPGYPEFGEGSRRQAVTFELSDKRVFNLQIWKAGEIPVGRPELSYTVSQAQCGDAGIMHHRPHSLCRQNQVFQPIQMIWTFTEKMKCRGSHPRPQRLYGDGHRCRRAVNLRMCYDGQKLMRARPRYSPQGHSIGQLSHHFQSLVVPRRIFPMGINQEICIYRNQDPCPSYAASRITLQEACLNSGARPLPLNVTAFTWQVDVADRLLMAYASPSERSSRKVTPCFLDSCFERRNRSSAISMVVFIRVTISLASRLVKS